MSTWNKPTDPCPKCGSTNTMVNSRQDVDYRGGVGGRRVPVAVNPRFTMLCKDCGNEESKSGRYGD
jgi:predicted nucleic-acid-binding Zn-ribbon protein